MCGQFRAPATALVRSTRAVASRRGRAWDEQAIRDQLTEFLRGKDVWPTCGEFAAGGAKGLREAITRINGAAWWAREMKVPEGDRRPGGVRRWTDARIRATLKELLGHRSTWPTQREFDEAGLHGLREALRHYGGPERWSRELGVTWTPRAASRSRRPSRETDTRATTPARDWPKWNGRTIARELRMFLAGREEWPRHREFVASGRKGLYHAVLKHGGSRLWAKRMGVAWVERHPGTAPPWTEDRVRERLAVFLRGRTDWPAAAEFTAAGQARLLKAARKFGGVEHWTKEFDLRPRTRSTNSQTRARRRRAGARSNRRATVGSDRVYWDDAQIEAAIAPLIEDLGRWPTKSEFRRAGLGKALAAVYGHGGSVAWQQRFGVTARESSHRVPDRRRWNAKLVEAELREFCQGRNTWPTYAEFQASGHRGLYQAANRYGGIGHWQSRIALQP